MFFFWWLSFTCVWVFCVLLFINLFNSFIFQLVSTMSSQVGFASVCGRRLLCVCVGDKFKFQKLFLGTRESKLLFAFTIFERHLLLYYAVSMFGNSVDFRLISRETRNEVNLREMCNIVQKKNHVVLGSVSAHVSSFTKLSYQGPPFINLGTPFQLATISITFLLTPNRTFNDPRTTQN